MKKTIFFLLLSLSFSILKAQETYTVNGETLQLTTEIDGTLDFLWNAVDKNYRYFIKTSDGTVTELKNTQDASGNFQKEYKTVLQDATKDANVSTEKVKFVLPSLRKFIDTYNLKANSNYTSQTGKSNIGFRLGIFGGITNSPFVENPNNTSVPLIGAELEIYQPGSSKKHTGFLQIKHSFEADDFKYETTEISLGYRFRFINASKFNIYSNVTFATLNFSKVTVVNTTTMTSTSESTTAFDAPVIFGVGADIKVSDNSFITLAYNELFALFLDEHGNFPVSFAAGYKINL